MASSLGSLVVSLGLDAAEFTQGLNRAEYQAKKTFENISHVAREAASLIGLAFGVEALREFSIGVVEGAENLHKLSLETGSTVEELSKLQNIAAVTGTSFDTTREILDKMAAAMGGATVKGTRVVEVLALLGITAKDPVQALTELAQKLNTFADGTGKAALLYDTFKLSGVQAAAALKALAENQDVLATKTTEQAAAAAQLAESIRKLGLEYHGLADFLLGTFAHAIIGAIEDFREAKHASDGFLDSLKLFAQLTNPFGSLDEQITDTEARIGRLKKAVDDVKSNPLHFDFGFGFGDSSAQLKQAEQALSILNDRKRKELAAAEPAVKRPQPPSLPPKGSGSVDDPAKAIFEQQLKAQEDFIKSEKDALSFRNQYLSAYYSADLIGLREYFAERQTALEDSVAKQSKAYDQEISDAVDFGSRKGITQKEEVETQTKINELIAKQAKLEQDAAQTTTLAKLEEVAAYRRLLDSIEQTSIALAAARGDTITAGLDSFDFANRQIKTQLQELAKSSRPEDQNASNIGLRDLQLLRDRLSVQLQLNAATQTYSQINDLLGISQTRISIAEKSGALTTLGALREQSALAAAYVPLLQKRLDILEAIPNKTLEEAIAVEKLRLEMEGLAATGDLVAKKFNDIGSGAFSTFLTDIVSGTKTLKQAFLDMTKSIEQSISKIAADELAQTLFKQGGALGGFGELFSGLFGGAKGGTGAAAASAAQAGALTSAGTGLTLSAGSLTASAAALTAAAAAITAAASASAAGGIGASLGGKVGGGLLDLISGDGGGFGLFDGIAGYAHGTTFARGGMAWVGENGPERMFVPRGSQIIPADKSTEFGRGISIVQNINVAAGASTQSARQAANLVREATLRAHRDH